MRLEFAILSLNLGLEQHCVQHNLGQQAQVGRPGPHAEEGVLAPLTVGGTALRRCAVLAPFTVGDVTHLLAKKALTPHSGSDTRSGL